MTVTEHMDKVALKYARAMVRWHITKDQDDWAAVCEWQELLNDLTVERAQEMLEELT